MARLRSTSAGTPNRLGLARRLRRLAPSVSVRSAASARSSSNPFRRSRRAAKSMSKRPWGWGGRPKTAHIAKSREDVDADRRNFLARCREGLPEHAAPRRGTTVPRHGPRVLQQVGAEPSVLRPRAGPEPPVPISRPIRPVRCALSLRRPTDHGPAQETNVGRHASAVLGVQGPLTRSVCEKKPTEPHWAQVPMSTPFLP